MTSRLNPDAPTFTIRPAFQVEKEIPDHAVLDRVATEFATVLTLDYEPNKRYEHSVIYLTTDFHLLEDLLDNPVEFFASRQDQWDELAVKKERCWHLRCPITAILRPGPVKSAFRDDATSIQDTRALALVYSFFNQAMSSTREANSQEDAAFLAVDGFERLSAPELADLLINEKGGFMAEFAIDTGVVNITYWSPAQPEVTNSRISSGENEGKPNLGILVPRAKEERRFKGTFTRGVLGLTPEIEGMVSGAMHIDLKDRDNVTPPTSRQRAQFIVDCVESNTRFPLLLTEESIYVSDAELNPRGKLSGFGTEKFERQKDEERLKLTKNDIHIPLDSDRRPTVIVDNLCACPVGQPCPACCCSQVIKTGEGAFMFEQILIKAYVCPTGCPPTN